MGCLTLRKATEAPPRGGADHGFAKPMPDGESRARGGSPWETLDEERVETAGIDYVAISVRDVGRSIRFYERLFGCQVVERDFAGSARALLNAGGGAYLALHERVDDRAETEPPSRWSFVVSDIDRARACVWNLGVPTVGGIDVPHRIHPWRRERSWPWTATAIAG